MTARTVSAIAGLAVTAAFLAVGVPLFLRMPLGGDTTLYDIAAQCLRSGGIHYRDVFDTNPPGFVWLLCGTRMLLGPSQEAVRVVDLGIVVSVSILLLIWARRALATHAGVAWAAAAIAAFYPFTREFNHAERDVWMMLPAVAAACLRMRRLSQDEAAVRDHRAFASPFIEGLLWGAGCWIKPQLLFVAAGVWLATSRRASFRDTGTVFAGGLIAGALGAVWLAASGTLPYFFDVWRKWNTAYAYVVHRELPYRLKVQLDYFPTYSVFALLAVPLAICNLRDRTNSDPARFRRAVLAVMYLSWFLTALFVQRPFDYIHVPETLLMIALFAANRWPVPAILVLVPTLSGILSMAAITHPPTAESSESSWVHRHLFAPHSAFDANRTKWWAGCFDRDPPPELRRAVGMCVDCHGGYDPVEIAAVAAFLREQDLHDSELIAWHDSPHVLYLELGLKPSFRFMHVGTAASLGPAPREWLLGELQAALPKARYVVSDMYRITEHYNELNEVGPDGLPLRLPAWQRNEFPFNQPVVFRSPSGRYIVHRIEKPVTSCAIPERLDQQKPNSAR